MKKAVIFDLDGTLLNTLQDLADSTNHVLKENGEPVHTVDEIRTYVGNGVHKLIERAVPADADPASIEKQFAEFKAWYGDHSMIATKPYEGIPDLLDALRARGIRTGVCSNKFVGAVKPLIAHYFGDRFDVVAGSSETVPCKPDPTMIRGALKEVGVSPADAYYVGDSLVDVQSGTQAGLDYILVSWGFGNTADLKKTDAVAVIDTPAELLDYL